VGREYIPDILAGLLVAAAFLVGIGIAYRRGFRAALTVRSAEFDFLTTSLALDGARWMLLKEPPGDQTDQVSLPEILDWRQAGSRVTFRGATEDGTVWQGEGIVEDLRVMCLARAVRGENSRPSIWMLRAEAAADKLTGYCIGWDRAGSMLSLREFSWERQTEMPFPAPSPPLRGRG
jgi:hypothetical protein